MERLDKFNLINNNNVLSKVHTKAIEGKLGFWFTLFFISVFYPLEFPLGPINLKFLYIFTPIFFIYTIIRGVGEKVNVSKPYLNFFYFAIFLLIFSALFSFVRHPVGSEKLFGSGEGKGGISLYAEIFINSLLFFTVIRYVKLINIEFYRLLKILALFSLLIGYLRLAGAFYGFDIPFVYGVFRYGETSKFPFTPNRIGGLEQAAIYGIVSIIAIIIYNNRNLKYLIALPLLIFLEIMSGGRTSFFGLLFVSVIYLVLFGNRKLKLFFVLFVSILLLYLIVPQDLLSLQFSRIFSIKGGIREQDYWRDTVYFFYLKNFFENPIFGKGIRPLDYWGTDPLYEFVASQLMGGGHGAYLSILNTFGIIGFIYLFIFVFGGILLAWKNLKLNIFTNNERTINLFCFLLLLIKSIIYYSGHNGYNDPTLFFLNGILIGTTIKGVYKRK